MANKRRMYRVAERIREIVSSELLSYGDSLLEQVTITSVVVSSDLRDAKVYWSCHRKGSIQEQVGERLQNIGRVVRGAVAKKLGTKFAPTIRFFFDDTLNVTEDVEAIFARLEQESQTE